MDGLAAGAREFDFASAADDSHLALVPVRWLFNRVHASGEETQMLPKTQLTERGREGWWYV